MRRLSPRAESLLGDIWAARDAAAAQLAALRATPEPALVPALVPLLFAATEPAPGIAAAVAALLRAAGPAALLWMEQEVRRRSRSLHGAYALARPWQSLSAAGLGQLAAAAGPDGPMIVAIGSFHADGRVREAAVAHLAAGRGGAEVPFLLLRLNDWVGPVRAAAYHAVEARCAPACAPALAASLPLIAQLVVYRRHDHAALARRLRGLLQAHPQVLVDALGSPHREVSRAAFALLAETEGVDVRAVVRAGLSARDLVVRVWAARAARRRLYGRALGEALGQARQDRAVPVRREAVAAFLDDYPELLSVLLDPCASLREMARFYLRKKANIDFAAVYRDAVAREADAGPEARGGAALPIALTALGETGGAGDAAVLLPHLADPRIAVRKAALRGIGRLAGPAHLPLLLGALRDAHRGVSRAAAEALRPHVAQCGGARLWGVIARADAPDHARTHVAPLLGQLPRWEALWLLLRAAGAPGGAAARDAIAAEIARWLSCRSFVAPSATERERLGPALAAAALPRDLAAAVAQHVALWR